MSHTESRTLDAMKALHIEGTDQHEVLKKAIKPAKDGRCINTIWVDNEFDESGDIVWYAVVTFE